ncbi:hypothetical protein CYA_2398 [Synechococcus sp. JA-3-3Ab]|nr:hypothetical protein CYA_2398 [Synechococcus sp. JA-3-3Ab]
MPNRQRSSSSRPAKLRLSSLPLSLWEGGGPLGQESIPRLLPPEASQRLGDNFPRENARIGRAKLLM